MARVEVEIMHGVPHRPDRAAVVARLVREADRACVHTDPKHRGPLFTLLECLRCAAESGSDQPWVIVCQDDAEPLPGWKQHVVDACQYSPEPVLGLSFVGRRSLKVSREVAYRAGKYTLKGGAFAIRRDLLPGLIAWSTPLEQVDGYTNDDVVLGAYSRWVGSATACVTHSIFRQRLVSTLRTGPVKWREALEIHHIGEGERDPDYARAKAQVFEDPLFDRDNPAICPALSRLLDYRFERQNAIVPTVLPREAWEVREPSLTSGKGSIR